ncbi:hypothetical protein [Conexibacter sp. CPCC 206217]|uniref:hypothetical protein n=1 Tax=Conexibacter sp. CPCC 206217 TaxID=3064574 RepID=UPI00271BE2EB|nr:hypothetical protein [Conexibacter sp. CPCC 206217]MDO8213475.1 hypothetical protein [Conexibacter sp. CPCC 206217]
MTKPVVFLVAAIVTLSVLVSAGPPLVAILDAAVPLVVAVGLVGAIVRLVWHYTSR